MADRNRNGRSAVLSFRLPAAAAGWVSDYAEREGVTVGEALREYVLALALLTHEDKNGHIVFCSEEHTDETTLKELEEFTYRILEKGNFEI